MSEQAKAIIYLTDMKPITTDDSFDDVASYTSQGWIRVRENGVIHILNTNHIVAIVEAAGKLLNNSRAT